MFSLKFIRWFLLVLCQVITSCASALYIYELMSRLLWSEISTSLVGEWVAWIEAQRMLLESCLCIWCGHSVLAPGLCLGWVEEVCPGDVPGSWGILKSSGQLESASTRLMTAGTLHEDTRSFTDSLNDITHFSEEINISHQLRLSHEFNLTFPQVCVKLWRKVSYSTISHADSGYCAIMSALSVGFRRA